MSGTDQSATIDPPRRLGRPLSVSSIETRSRIIDSARKCFAEQGFEASTNRVVAAHAGISTGAIYHYFESKTEMYLAVYADVQMRVYEDLERAASRSTGFVGKLCAVLESAHDLNRSDPTLAVFLGSARVDLRRHPELFAVVRQVDHFAKGGFFSRLVDVGIASGEIVAGDRERVEALLLTVTVGLSDAVADNLEAQRRAIDGFEALLAGRLLEPPTRLSGEVIG